MGKIASATWKKAMPTPKPKKKSSNTTIPYYYYSSVLILLSGSPLWPLMTDF